MSARRIVVRVLWSLLFVLSLCCASCALVMSFDHDTGGDTPGEARSVRGTVDGLESATVVLTLNDGERLEVGNGAFEFPTGVLDGSGYFVAAQSPAGHACSVTGGTGIITAVPATVTVRCPSTNAQLSALSIARTTLTPAFAPTREGYAGALASAVQLLTGTTTTVTAATSSPSARIRVQGAAVISGQPISVSVGGGPQKSIAIVVTAASGAERRYEVDFRKSITPAYVKASNTRRQSHFGSAVARDGDTLVVGAPFESSNATGVNGNQSDSSLSHAGAVYVFRRSATGWKQEAYLKASNTHINAEFGISVALRGNELVVGAHNEANSAKGIDQNQSLGTATTSGAVYVFQRTGTAWAQKAYLKASNTRPFARFGASLALDGDTLIVGSPGESSSAVGIDGDQEVATAPTAGAVYAFQRNGSTWQQAAYIKASNTRASTLFGDAVALHGDTLAVGAPSESSNATGIGNDQTDVSATGAGAVFVFQRTAATWQQQAYVKASNTRAAARFGTSLALASNGDTLVVGSPYESSNAIGVDGNQADASMPNAGAVYLLERNGAIWQHRAYLKSSNTRSAAFFGGALALADDAVLVGSSGETSKGTGVDGDQSAALLASGGAAYLFGTAGETWVQRAYLKAPNTQPNGFFGSAVALSPEGLVVGSDGEASKAKGIDGDQSDISELRAGAAYVY
jgi:hypothetical protein